MENQLPFHEPSVEILLNRFSISRGWDSQMMLFLVYGDTFNLFKSMIKVKLQYFTNSAT